MLKRSFIHRKKKALYVKLIFLNAFMCCIKGFTLFFRCCHFFWIKRRGKDDVLVFHLSARANGIVSEWGGWNTFNYMGFIQYVHSRMYTVHIRRRFIGLNLFVKDLTNLKRIFSLLSLSGKQICFNSMKKLHSTSKTEQILMEKMSEKQKAKVTPFILRGSNK